LIKSLRSKTDLMPLVAALKAKRAKDTGIRGQHGNQSNLSS